ncbi:hypothetical protein RRG08_059652 [Elysia crispata]|uniref:Uncharacterized protein n=1 Tax=Elysia crispata TaxID=231223 RepID=A0AAE1E9T1_9GAST|nr:hypothetical protein RRG08_059652 [Elysia crispata]
MQSSHLDLVVSVAQELVSMPVFCLPGYSDQVLAGPDVVMALTGSAQPHCLLTQIAPDQGRLPRHSQGRDNHSFGGCLQNFIEIRGKLFKLCKNECCKMLTRRALERRKNWANQYCYRTTIDFYSLCLFR